MSNFVINVEAPVIQNKSQIKKTRYFHSTDSLELYEKNCNKFGKEWYYYENEITYKFNSWGYRTKEFHELDRDYMLTFGCSNTEGIGLNLNDTWTTNLSKTLNLDLFNLGMGGTGIDFQFYNTTLISDVMINQNKLPKLVVYQWPNYYRSCQGFTIDRSKDKPELLVTPYSPQFIVGDSKNEVTNAYYNSFIEGFVNDGGDLYRQTFMYQIMCNNIWKSLGVPVINWRLEDGSKIDGTEFMNLNYEMINILDYDDPKIRVWARDQSHCGIPTQIKIVNTLINNIKKREIKL